MARVLSYCFTGVAIAVAGFAIFTYIGVIWAGIYAITICIVNGIGGKHCP